MRTLKIAAVTVLALLFVLVIAGFALPAKWVVARATVVNAPASAIYPLVADFKTGWPQWCEFDTEDPNITYSYEGPASGTGAKRNWVSKSMGDGYQTITSSDPAKGVEFELGMPAQAMVLHGTITLSAVGNATLVTWTDTGTVGSNPMQHWFAFLADKIMGGSFERSLERLKQKAEAPASAR
jgi:hypothetical protein